MSLLARHLGSAGLGVQQPACSSSMSPSTVSIAGQNASARRAAMLPLGTTKRAYGAYMINSRHQCNRLTSWPVVPQTYATALAADSLETDSLEETLRKAHKVSVLPAPMIAEAEDLKKRFIAIQQEVTAYKALTVENAKLQEDLDKLRRQKEEALQALAAEREARAGDAAAAEARLTEAAAATRRAEASAADTAEELQADNARLRASLGASIQRLAAAISASSSSSETTDTTISKVTSGTSSGSEADATIDELVSKHLEEEAAAAAAAEEARKRRAALWPLRAVLGAVVAALYSVAAGLLLYYAASILAGVPPRITLEFSIGCVIVAWAIRLLRAIFRLGRV